MLSTIMSSSSYVSIRSSSITAGASGCLHTISLNFEYIVDVSISSLWSIKDCESIIVQLHVEGFLNRADSVVFCAIKNPDTYINFAK